MNRPPLNTPPLPSLGTNALTFSVRGSSGGPHCPRSARVRTEEGGAGEGTGRGDSQGGRVGSKLPEHVPNLDFVLRMVELISVMGNLGGRGLGGEGTRVNIWLSCSTVYLKLSQHW